MSGLKNKKIDLARLEGDHLIASFLFDKSKTGTLGTFLKILLDTLKKNEIYFNGIYKRTKKWQEITISDLTFNSILSEDLVEIYFIDKGYGKDVLFYAGFYKFSEKYFGMDVTTSQFELTEKNSERINTKNILRFYRMAKDIFVNMKPVYGLIGHEEFVPNPDWIIGNIENAPHFWSFYSKEMVDVLGHDRLKAIMKDAYKFEQLADGSIFFALFEWTKSEPNKKHERMQKQLLELLREKKDALRRTWKV